MIDREQYAAVPASGAQARKDGAKWTLIIVLAQGQPVAWVTYSPLLTLALLLLGLYLFVLPHANKWRSRRAESREDPRSRMRA